MSETKFTPGPWSISNCSCGHRSCHRMQPGPGMFYQGTGYDSADAHLIAAAPELYEALEKAVPEIEDNVRSLIECHSIWTNGKPDRTTIDPEVGEFVAMLEALAASGRAALAKARGEQP